MPPARRRRSAIYDPDYRYMLSRLKVARRASGLTQVEVSIALRRAQNFVSRCESGERRIDPIDLLRLAAIYQKPLAFFLPTPRQ
jgi:transcriptional regulator with XRE-family HTH domain